MSYCARVCKVAASDYWIRHVSPSVCTFLSLQGTTRFQLEGFLLKIFILSVEETAALLQWDLNIRYFTWRPEYWRFVITVRHLALFLTEWRKSQRRFVETFKAHTSCKIVLSENRTVYEVITKILQNQTGARWPNTIRCKKSRFACWVIAAKIREVSVLYWPSSTGWNFLLRRASMTNY
jgi:hypothetical protein